MSVRPLSKADCDWVLALSDANVVETSAIDAAWLAHAIAQAFAALASADDAFLIAFAQGADYSSPNFHWFGERIARFVYVDRVVVAAAARGRGHARALYEHLIEVARAAGHDRVVCEVNVDPPNPGSDAFHAALGFHELGRARLANGKTVRYLSRSS